MARTLQRRELGIWMNGKRVGRWLLSRGRQHSFLYDDSWLESTFARPLSLSLPLQSSSEPHTGDRVEYYFDNLLPDSVELRKRIQRSFGIRSADPFDLLAEVGRDCVGAVQILPIDAEPKGIHSIHSRPLTEGEVADLLRRVPGTVFPNERDPFRISIAGAQEKTALLQYGGIWHLPVGTTPTTHIFKLPLGRIGNGRIDLSTSVENEWLCSTILEAYGVPVANTEIQYFEDQKVLIVERFDRQFAADGSWIMRLPQEDMCQVFGIASEQKYESDGGPGIPDIMSILFGSKNPDRDRKLFFKVQILYWMLAGIDGHAKNFSIFLEREGRFSLTPLYDVLSAYPVMGKRAGMIPKEELRMAMAVHGKNRHYRLAGITARHWVQTAGLCGLDISPVEEILESLVSDTPAVVRRIQEILPSEFPSAVSETILNGLEEAAENLAR
ncbi:MAG: type II toxin-antitoxin system HipA family toxin [Spirochaetales bacterium]|nr:type II toxin-antitoxin system HipA family toxin [Spirochaetales bacterium]MCF7938280.1 type II toxin-antitoxin system HipA family toxin [Spirochaetales bacterium]